MVFTKKLVARARQNAKGRRGLAFSLTADDMLPLLVAAGWKCSVTGTPFSLEKIANRRPFAPSIDRIDSGRGYAPDNCRIVCVAANYAMNMWGAEVLRRLIRGGRVLDSFGHSGQNTA